MFSLNVPVHSVSASKSTEIVAAQRYRSSHTERLNDGLEELEGQLREWLRRDGVADEDIEVARMLDCRYAGQGYELRLVLENGRFTEADLDRFHALHEREYGHSFGDPIEIVNARVSAVGRRPALAGLRAESGDLQGALVGEHESTFRVNGSLESLPTRFYDRRSLPIDEALPGPAIVFHPDTTTLVPPSWNVRAEASGNLILRRS